MGSDPVLRSPECPSVRPPHVAAGRGICDQGSAICHHPWDGGEGEGGDISLTDSSPGISPALHRWVLMSHDDFRKL